MTSVNCTNCRFKKGQIGATYVNPTQLPLATSMLNSRSEEKYTNGMGMLKAHCEFSCEIFSLAAGDPASLRRRHRMIQTPTWWISRPPSNTAWSFSWVLPQPPRRKLPQYCLHHLAEKDATMTPATPRSCTLSRTSFRHSKRQVSGR